MNFIIINMIIIINIIIILLLLIIIMILLQQSDREIRENVSSLVQKHQEETRHLNDLRQREKSIMDQRLQSKLAAKKNRKIEEVKEEEEGSQPPQPRRQIMCPDI